MLHTLVFNPTKSALRPEDAVFDCAVCGYTVGFNLPGLGEPAAIADGDAYLPPANAEIWCSADCLP